MDWLKNSTFAEKKIQIKINNIIFKQMNRLKIGFYVMITAFIATSCMSGYNVIHVNKDTKPGKKAGFYYSLPQTYVKVNVKVEQVEKIKGPYVEYANKYLGLQNIIKENSTSYQIADVEINTESERDPNQYYFVETNCKRMYVSMDKTGLIKAVNPMRGRHEESNKNRHSEADNKLKGNGDYPELFKNFVDLNLYEKVDTLYRDVEGDTGIVKETILKKTIMEKPTEQKAKEMVDFINKLKETRISYLNGDQDVKDKASLEFIYNELQTQENDYLKLFSGITVKHTLNYTFYYLPVKDTSSKTETNIVAPICKFSASKGIVDNSSKDGEVVNLCVKSMGNIAVANNYNQQKTKLDKGKHGFSYRVPEYADVSVVYHNNTLKETKKLISQLGMIVNLPRSSRSINYDVNSGSINMLMNH